MSGLGGVGEVYGNVLGSMTKRQPTIPLYALAGQGGGGSYPANAIFSTVTVLEIDALSSINGVAYTPAAENPDPSFSSVTMNGSITMGNNTFVMGLGGSDAKIYLNSSDSNVYIQGLSTFDVRLGTVTNPVAVGINDNTTTIFNALTAPELVAVSSINGLPYTGGGGNAPFVSSIGLVGGSNTGFVGASNYYQLTDAFSTLSSHLYQVTVTDINFDNADTNSVTKCLVSGLNGSPAIFTIPNLFANSNYEYSETSGSCMIIPTSNTVANVLLQNTSPTVSTSFQINITNGTGVVVVDYGLISA